MAANKSPSSSRSYFQKTVTLLDWWLTKPQTNADTNTLGVAGRTSQQFRAARCYSSAPILKIYDLFELETVDGVCVILQGFINKDRTLENGFSPEVFDHFVIGFPPNWKEFSTNCPKRESAAKCVTQVQEEDVKDSIEGPGDFHGQPQNFDNYTVDMGVQDCEDITLSNNTIMPLDPPSVETPQEHIIEAENKILCERSPVTPGFVDDPSPEMSPIVSNALDSSTRLKCLGVSSRRVTRSMQKMDNSKNISNLDKETPIDPGILGSSESLRKDINDVISDNNKALVVVDYDVKSKSRNVVSNETTSCFEDTVLSVISKRQRFDQNVDAVATTDIRNGISNQGKNKDDADVNDNIVLTRSNMKGRRNKKKRSPQKGVPETHGISSKEAIMTRSKPKTKLPVKRKLIASPKSARSTSSRGKKGFEGSANILSLESFSGKKSRSGRVVLPPLEFWRNQKLVYDEDGQVCGVQKPK